MHRSCRLPEYWFVLWPEGEQVPPLILKILLFWKLILQSIVLSHPKLSVFVTNH